MDCKKGHKVSSEAECGTLFGVLLWPVCWGWVSLGQKKACRPSRPTSPPEARAQQEPALSPICSAELAEPTSFCLSWLSVNCAKVDLQNKDIA